MLELPNLGYIDKNEFDKRERERLDRNLGIHDSQLSASSPYSCESLILNSLSVGLFFYILCRYIDVLLAIFISSYFKIFLIVMMVS